jgi:3-oxoacid CoA-transferase subunit B
VVLMEHTAGGKPKLLKHCTLPLTGAGVVDMVVTDLGVFSVDRQAHRFILRELAPDVTVDQVQAATEAALTVASDLKAAA